MGMFDSLIWTCAFCGDKNMAQTKAGPCMMDDFNMEDELPTWLMEAFDGREEACYKCNKKFKFVFELEIKVKCKELIAVDNLDYIELEYRKKLEKQKKARLKKKLNKGL